MAKGKRGKAPAEALPLRKSILFHLGEAEKYLKGRQPTRAEWHLMEAKEASAQLATIMESLHPMAEVVAS